MVIIAHMQLSYKQGDHIWSSYAIRGSCKTLTLYGPNSFFRRFSGHNLR